MTENKRIVRTSYINNAKYEPCPECGKDSILVATKKSGIIIIKEFELYSCNCGCLWEVMISYRNIILEFLERNKLIK